MIYLDSLGNGRLGALKKVCNISSSMVPSENNV